MNSVKKISAIVMSLVLIMCAGYFSVMSPTTAWFYQSQSVSGANNKFVFADFDIDGEYSFEKLLTFDGATAYADETETMFDSVVKVMDVEVKNEGGLPARVYSTVENKTESKGLRYFCYTDDMIVNGSVKETIRKALNNNLNDRQLDVYNIGEDGNGGFYVNLNPGETKKVKVALWLEYDECSAELAFAESAWETVDYQIEITMTATEDFDGAMER